MKKVDDISMLLQRIDLVDVLRSFGKDVGQLRHGMCRSPFRDEDSPSFRIVRRNGVQVWADYGAPLTLQDSKAGRKVHGGGVLDLVMELGGMGRSQAVDYLASMVPGRYDDVCASSVKSERTSSFVVDSVSRVFTRTSLLDYACGQRCIPRNVLERWCSEVCVHLEGVKGRRTFMIGFPNDRGGWILRGRGAGRLSKVSTSSYFTSISSRGQYRPDAPESGRVFVFEGFMDFLSWMAWGGRDVPGYDVCVLNSVSNLAQAAGWIGSHREIGVCFDNDKAGRDALEAVGELCPDSFVKDCSQSYGAFNDLNEMYADLVKRGRSRSGGMKI